MAVQNYNDSWSAPKGHLKINEDHKLEISWETFLRELFEEFSIEFQIRNTFIKVTKDNYVHYVNLYPKNYFESYVDDKPNSNDRKRLIGLFFIRIDERNLRFNLADNKENKVIEKINYTKYLIFFYFSAGSG